MIKSQGKSRFYPAQIKARLCGRETPLIKARLCGRETPLIKARIHSCETLLNFSNTIIV